MARKASELSEAQKMEIMVKLREHLGDEKFGELLQACGPDGVIEAVLGQTDGEKSESGIGFWGGIGILFVAVMCYCWALNSLQDAQHENLWWHYLVAVPLGLVLLWLFAGGLELLLPWGVPFLALGGMVELFRRELPVWTILAGVVCLLVGGSCGWYAASERSKVGAWNCLCFLLLGLAGVIVGIVRAVY